MKYLILAVLLLTACDEDAQHAAAYCLELCGPNNTAGWVSGAGRGVRCVCGHPGTVVVDDGR